MDGQFEGGIGFRVEARVQVQGGSIRVEAHRLVVSDATEILVTVNSARRRRGRRQPPNAPGDRRLRTTGPRFCAGIAGCTAAFTVD